jgi:hypothetical protein
MKINFFTLTDNLNTGSYRIWVNDLSKTLNELPNIESKIVYFNLNEIDGDADVIIFCKSAYKLIKKFKKKEKHTLIGAINVSCDYYDENIDFVICGSPEEYVSLSSYKNVFIYPLIERKYQNLKIKEHFEKDTFDVCFHGHYPHLFKFEPFIKNALEYYNNHYKKVKIKVITGNKDFPWKTGKPNVEVEMYDYNDEFVNIVQSCDIGIVPNVSDLRLFVKDLQGITSVDYGLYNTDYFIRMKNKTNAGRAYVFYQLGLPVIHDLSPSSFELMCKTGYNICAHDEKSYLREFLKLSNHKFRNKVSKENLRIFNENYNPHIHAKKMLSQIRRIQ